VMKCGATVDKFEWGVMTVGGDIWVMGAGSERIEAREFCTGIEEEKIGDPWIVKLVRSMHSEYTRPVGNLEFAWTGMETFFHLSLHFLTAR
jgi:hypothetical protein